MNQTTKEVKRHNFTSGITKVCECVLDEHAFACWLTRDGTFGLRPPCQPAEWQAVKVRQAATGHHVI